MNYLIYIEKRITSGEKNDRLLIISRLDLACIIKLSILIKSKKFISHKFKQFTIYITNIYPTNLKYSLILF